MRVLVTGASGLIGRQVLSPLRAAGHHVIAVSRREAAYLEEEVVRADLLKEAEQTALLRHACPDALLHLAWDLGGGADVQEEWRGASLRLARLFREGGGRRLVVAGTCAEYDTRCGVCVENVTTIRPHSAYARAKVELHDALGSLPDLSLAWARIFYVYGPGEGPHRLVAAVTRALLAGEDVATTEGEQIRDYLYSGDVAAALVSILGSRVSGAVNVSSGRGIRVRDIIRRLACGIQGGGRPLPGARAAGHEVPMVIGSPRRLRRELGWHPVVGLEDGLGRTVRWWRDEMSRG